MNVVHWSNVEKSCNAVKQYLNIFPHNGHLAVRPDCVPRSVGLYRQLSHKLWAVLGLSLSLISDSSGTTHMLRVKGEESDCWFIPVSERGYQEAAGATRLCYPSSEVTLACSDLPAARCLHADVTDTRRLSRRDNLDPPSTGGACRCLWCCSCGLVRDPGSAGGVHLLQGFFSPETS